MKYKKGTFVVVPNKEYLSGKPSELQTIFFWLCDHADEEGVCFPSRRTLARESGCGLKTVDKYLTQLEQGGFIEKTYRFKPGSAENDSNLYQIMVVEAMDNCFDVAQETLHPSIQNATPGGVEKGAVTIPSINSNQGTIVPDDESSADTYRYEASAGMLPLSRGATRIQRVVSVYKDLFRNIYKVEPTLRMIPVGASIDKLAEKFTELQISALLITFFNWKGISGDSDFEQKKLLQAVYAFGWFYTGVTQYEVYLRNVFGLKFDNEDDVREFVAKNLLALNK